MYPIPADVRVGSAPCKDCTERHESCHSHCCKYIEWKERHDKVKHLDDEYRASRNRVDDYEVARVNKARRRAKRI